MPGETMTDEGYGVLDVSWTLTHDLTHVGCMWWRLTRARWRKLFLGKGFCVKISCIVSSLTMPANVHKACWSTFELLLHNWGEKNKERNVDSPRQLGTVVVSGESMRVPC